MNLLLDFHVLGWLMLGLAGFQTVPIGAALIYGEPIRPYLATGLVALVYGLAIVLSVRPKDRRLRGRDGFLVVSGAWLLASFIGALPYYLADSLSPLDALFESVAGFTTTGSSVFEGIEEAPRALVVWRALSQWLGGMGIIVFAIAVLPLLGVGGMQLFHAEVPGPVSDKLTPRITVTARRLWLIYLGVTVLAFISLRFAGLNGFEAFCHGLTTAATGGFSTRTGSIGAFGLPAVEWVVIAFMVIGGINYVLHYRLLTGGARGVMRDGELRFFLVLMAVGVASVTWLLAEAGSVEAPLRAAAFQTVSLLTTTGYVTADYELWPAAFQFLVVPLLVIGGMAGSTSGGLKTLRVLIILRSMRVFVLRLSHPLAVRPVRLAGRPVGDDVVMAILIFVATYFALALGAAMVIAAAGYDVVTAITAALTAVGNVGPALGAVGPTDSFAHFPATVKLTLCFCMIAGRLEVFTLLVLLEPHFWRR